jgi:hypothetical protein
VAVGIFDEESPLRSAHLGSFEITGFSQGLGSTRNCPSIECFRAMSNKQCNEYVERSLKLSNRGIFFTDIVVMESLLALCHFAVLFIYHHCDFYWR